MILGIALALPPLLQEPVHQATGIKVGEVTQTTALVWVRATRDSMPVREGPEFERKLKFGDKQLPEGVELDAMRHAVPSAAGAVRVSYWAAGDNDAEALRSTAWTRVDASTDGTHVFALTGLAAGTAYELVSEARPDPEGSVISSSVAGSFRTAPEPQEEAEVTFTVSTCQDFPRRDDPARGHKIYAVMAGMRPDFFAQLGDILYYDKPAPFASNVALARHKWNRMYGLEFQRDFHARVPAYHLKDDHDLLKNDSWPGQTYGELTWDDGLRLFREQLPAPRADATPYRTVRWGRDLQIWLTEGREFRSSNRMQDGPDKTILGAQQKAWLERTLRESDAPFKVLFTAAPIVGPDRTTKNDNHANAGFAHEGAWLRGVLAEVGAVVITGDRHWQYVARDPETGLLEIGCGPASDAHAGGYPKKPLFEPEFVRVQGGFLSVAVGGGRAAFRHHDVEGALVHETVVDR